MLDVVEHVYIRVTQGNTIAATISNGKKTTINAKQWACYSRKPRTATAQGQAFEGFRWRDV